jgi:hypothetical protein
MHFHSNYQKHVNTLEKDINDMRILTRT